MFNSQLTHLVLSYIVFIAMAYFLSENRKLIKKREIALGVAYHILFAVIMHKIPSVSKTLYQINLALKSIADSSAKGVSVVFGGLARPETSGNLGFIMSLHSLPLLIVISALSAVLIYLKILPFFIKIFSYIFQKTLRIGGTLGIAVSTNIFAGIAETPLVITPYLRYLTRSELFTLIVCGMAGLASSVIVLIDVIIKSVIPNSIVYIISSVLIGIPMAVTISKIMIPETSNHLTGAKDMDIVEGSSLIEALFSGIMNGAKVVVTIVSMLIGFVALIDILNKILELLPEIYNHKISVQMILGIIMMPISWLIGIPSDEIIKAGSLIGTKIAFNEVIAFQDFASIGNELSTKSQIIILCALGGFANFGSVGLAVGVYSMLIPERRNEVIKIGMKALLAGNIVNLLNAALVGFICF